MDISTWEPLRSTLMYTTLPGGGGGITAFIWSLRRGHYKNNRLVSKLSIEIIGAMLTASFVTTLIDSRNATVVAIAFAIGVAWAGIIQVVREWITRVVKAALGGSDKTDS